MCGIIGVISRPPTRPAPRAENLLGGLDAAIESIPVLDAVITAAREVNAALHGLPGVLALSGQPELVAALTTRLDRLDTFAKEREVELDANVGQLSADDLEAANAELIELADVLWAIRNDRFRTAREVEALSGRDATVSAKGAYLVAQQAFSAIDRLEVRGRDSAGIHLFVWNHDIDADSLVALVSARGSDPLFENGSVVSTSDADGNSVLSFVYKQAAEIGELGDNTAVLRAALAADGLLRRAVSSPKARASLIGHTRWASVGIISEPNTHPLNSAESEQLGGEPNPYVVAVLNGDVDNHGDLRAEHELRIAGPITTDAKVIPT
ncbi:MAG: glucosamine--fructose-6-phosphate aminotransferase (isomerizing), partial [Ilumatobacter sp.]